MVFLQGVARGDSPAAECLRLAEARRVQLCMSEAVLQEVASVLARPELRQRFPALTPSRIVELCEALARLSIVLSEVPSLFTSGRDPKDAK